MNSMFYFNMVISTIFTISYFYYKWFTTCFNERYVKLIYSTTDLGDVTCQHMGFEPETLCLHGGCSTYWPTEAGVQGSHPGTQWITL